MEPDRIAPGILGMVHVRVCPLHQLGLAGFVVDEQYHANAGAAMVCDGAMSGSPGGITAT